MAATALQPFELETVSSLWQLALAGAQRALAAETGVLPAAELRRRGLALRRERRRTLQELIALARISRLVLAPWQASFGAMGVVTLTVVQNEPEADVIVGLLRASGIKSFHRTTDFPASAYGSMSPVEVVVDEADLAKAQQALEAR